VMPCFRDWLPGSVLASFQSTSAFLTSGFLPCLLVGFVPFFYALKDWSVQAIH
jgi:hypothetical protein